MWFQGSSLSYRAAVLFTFSITSALSSGEAGTSRSVVTFNNRQRLLFDVDGRQIDAYGSKVNFFDGKYYLYGNSFSAKGVAYGIKSYSSVDLVNWKYEGLLYDPAAPGNPCLDPNGGCGRPHILHNRPTGKYVLWANAGTQGYVIATSTSPAGPFAFLSQRAAIDAQFDGLQPADFAVESFGDKAHLVFSALNFRDPRAGSIWPPIFQTLHISELSTDFTNTTLTSYPVTSAENDLFDQETESPDLFMRNGVYYVAASNTCAYCNSSPGLMYRSTSIRGPWTRQIISGDSCGGQVEGVLPLSQPTGNGTSYIWHSTSVPGGPRIGFGGHIFQPLQFSADGSVGDLNCSPSAEFPVAFAPATKTVASGAATSAVDKTPLQAAYNAVCDSDQYDLFQTWTASRSGTIKSVSINVAKSVQTIPLSVTIFKYSDNAALISPGYKWTTLGSAIANATSLTFVFDVLTVPVTSNATVEKGDRLGFALTGADFAPYCHLEYDAGDSLVAKLYQRSIGQNHYQGGRAKSSPVIERTGKGAKFFVTYQ